MVDAGDARGCFVGRERKNVCGLYWSKSQAIGGLPDARRVMLKPDISVRGDPRLLLTNERSKNFNFTHSSLLLGTVLNLILVLAKSKSGANQLWHDSTKWLSWQPSWARRGLEFHHSSLVAVHSNLNPILFQNRSSK